MDMGKTPKRCKFKGSNFILPSLTLAKARILQKRKREKKGGGIKSFLAWGDGTQKQKRKTHFWIRRGFKEIVPVNQKLSRNSLCQKLSHPHLSPSYLIATSHIIRCKNSCVDLNMFQKEKKEEKRFRPSTLLPYDFVVRNRPANHDTQRQTPLVYRMLLHTITKREESRKERKKKKGGKKPKKNRTTQEQRDTLSPQC